MSDQFENDGPYQDAVSAEEIERRIMDSAFPKNSMEWWAHREIKELRARIAELKSALKPFAAVKEKDIERWYGLDPDPFVHDDVTLNSINNSPTVGDLRAARAVMKREKR